MRAKNDTLDFGLEMLINSTATDKESTADERNSAQQTIYKIDEAKYAR